MPIDAPGPGIKDGPVLIFTHLPRTAGTTLNGILHREYGAGFHKVVDGLTIEDGVVTSGREPYVAMPEADRRRIRAIAGHMSYGIHAWVPGDYRYVTLVRDPVDRIISLYHYIAEQPRHRLHRLIAVDGWTLDDFIAEDPMFEVLQFDNGQLRLLTGAVSKSQLPRGAYAPDLLAEAIRRLEQYDLVGTTDRFDELLVLASRRYGWKPPVYRVINATRARSTTASIASSTRARILELNLMDTQLYEFARQRIDDAIDTAGADMSRDLAAFRELNSDPDISDIV